jgi:EAL domain-containing protein (putative c-di-GMP-specific phosphodiesterase class I)
MSPADRPAVPTATSAPPGDLGLGWAEAVAGVLADPSRHRLAFQPVVDLQRGTVAGYEALSRFAGPPDAGPDVWFEAAGRHGLGPELDARVLERVVGLRPELPPNCFLTVNLDPNHLVTEPVQRALSAAPTLAGVVIELTEHRPVADYPTLVAAVAELRLRDAKLAVDDAGAGYAGLQHLMLLRPDLVKLDRALVAGCDRDPAKAALIEMLGRFTGQLDAWVLAEGIERMAELESLIRLRVPWPRATCSAGRGRPCRGAGRRHPRPPGRPDVRGQRGRPHRRRASVRAGEATAAAARWLEADPSWTSWSWSTTGRARSGWSTGPAPPAGGPAQVHRAQDPPVGGAGDGGGQGHGPPRRRPLRPLICVDDRGHYLGVLRVA